jgi:hypothetical protein
MISNDRISRKQRLRTLRNYKAKIAVALAIVLILMVTGRIIGPRLGSVVKKTPLVNIFHSGGSDKPDSVAIRMGLSFRLSKAAGADTVFQDSLTINLIRIKQPWPSGLPFEYYAQRIQEVSKESGIDCNCVQYGEYDSLICDLKSGGYRAIVVVDPDRRTNLKGRYLGVILKNVYRLNARDIASIVSSGIPFGYLAAADVFPAGEVKRELRSNWTASILRLSLSREDLLKYNIIKEGKDPDYRKIASDLLHRHPKTSLIALERSGEVDYRLAEAIIDGAKEEDIGYIYDPGTIDRIDSLAYSAGLTFVTLSEAMDYTEMNSNMFRSILYNDLILSENPAKMLVIADITRIGAGEYVKIMKFLRGIGVNILDINKLSDRPEFTIEDL